MAEVDAHWHTERRDEMALQGYKALLLLNSGGAVALLAFLQSVWAVESARPLLLWTVVGMIPLLIGAALAGATIFARYQSSMAWQIKGAEEGRKMTRLHNLLTAASFASFLLGMGIVVTGALCNLPAS